MAEQDHKQIWNLGKAVDHEADRLLDAALAEYASVEPRPGLEARILANLRAEQMQTPKRTWWRLSLAAAAITVLAVAVSLALRSGKPPHPVNATVKPNPDSRGTQLVLNLGGSPVRGTGVPSRKHLAQRAAVRSSQRDHVAGAIPKLDHFPSPRPLSEQEKLLRSYVAGDLEQAVLVARARSEALRQDELEEMKASFVDHDGDSEQKKNDTTER